ncbi:hypothetical protein E1281_28200 [Actinomadura sp. KC345]|uniref:hypothetical protein n=1 Tax=Actinomadura sp. KC345 TaxID=2530371 RepID=UPI00104CCCD4|nr:hypothetical protein [Actinomadura sp. KC345]TDC46315.1 hypothetical protein E1281_28200 [Actinomadura sp. KC345]
MLRLYDPRTGRAEPPPAGRGLRIQVLDGAGPRTLVVTDLLRRVAERAGRRVRVVSTPAFAGEHAWPDYGVAPFEVLDTPIADADVHVSTGGGTGGDRLTLNVPRETGAWEPADAPSVRLAILEVPYREPLELSEARVSRAGERLDGWRAAVARWATAPGRPMSRDHAAEAETALADDLGSPAALDVLDRLAADAEVPPGAKLETFIHLDLLLALGLVSAIGSA